MTLGEYVKQYRMARNMKQKDFAKLCGLYPTQLSSIESDKFWHAGKIPLDSVLLQKLAAGMKLNPEVILDLARREKGPSYRDRGGEMLSVVVSNGSFSLTLRLGGKVYIYEQTIEHFSDMPDSLVTKHPSEEPPGREYKKLVKDLTAKLAPYMTKFRPCMELDELDEEAKKALLPSGKKKADRSGADTSAGGR